LHFKLFSWGYSRQDDVANPLFREQFIDKLIHVNQFKPAITLHSFQFAEILQQRFQVLVTIHRGPDQPHVDGTQASQVLEVLTIFNVLDHHLLVRLDLQHLEHQAHERSRVNLCTVHSPKVRQLASWVKQCPGIQSKALLLPIASVPDTLLDDIFHLGEGCRGVRGGGGRERG
jgi:hypothetical protein